MDNIAYVTWTKNKITVHTADGSSGSSYWPMIEDIENAQLQGDCVIVTTASRVFVYKISGPNPFAVDFHQVSCTSRPFSSRKDNARTKQEQGLSPCGTDNTAPTGKWNQWDSSRQGEDFPTSSSSDFAFAQPKKKKRSCGCIVLIILGLLILIGLL